MKKYLLFFVFILGITISSIQAQNRPYVILVSFDGFRYDYVEKYHLKNFQAFYENGSRAEGLIPSYPSLTFPNHYSIVTGLYPGHHGLVANSFYDTATKSFYSIRERDKVSNPIYYGGKPIWQLAKENGIKTASYYWVGSEVKDEAKRPDYYYIYNDTTSPETKIHQAGEWLRLPEKDRPHLITLYFPHPDHESHRHGPFSNETQKALAEMDEVLGKLMKEIESTGLPINVVLVSDHGMSELKSEPETYINLDAYMNVSDTTFKLIFNSTMAHIYTSSQRQKDSIIQLLKAKENNFTVYDIKNVPASWHYDNARCGDIIIVAAPYHYIQKSPRKKQGEEGGVFGVHGYDPMQVNDMKGIFYASGPNIKKGIFLPAFSNVNIYPFLAELLEINPPQTDGEPGMLRSIYKRK